jgi:ABC-2 type transport system ATP-binding protein
MSEKLIEVQDLAKHFDNTHAVQGISFDVARGSVSALLGGNGAGKTTTIAMLLGLVTPSAGQVWLFGQHFDRRQASILGRMNFSSPYFDLPSRLTVQQNLLVYARLYAVDKPQQRVAQLADELQLGSLLRRRYGSLSAGQKTRVAMAKAMINNPQLLLLDEPTASLDPDSADMVRGFLERQRLHHGTTILIASHNMYEVERLCDDVIMLRMGRVVDRDTPAGLLQRYGRNTLEEVFLDIVRQPSQESRL